MATLAATLEEVGQGRGGVVLLAGEPGIGKTRLLEEFAGLARRTGAEVPVGRCWEHPGAPAFWPWVNCLRGLAGSRTAEALRALFGPGAADIAALVPAVRAVLPEVAPVDDLDSPHARFRLFDSITRALGAAAGARPLVLLIDDLQGADRPSLLLLEFVARAVREWPCLVVGAHRDVGLVSDHPLSFTVAELVRAGVRARLVLHGLSRTAVAELVAAATGGASPDTFVAALYARTAGNPLFVTELLRLEVAQDAGAESGCIGIPATVRAVLAQRLAPLSPTARAALAVGALIGHEFELDVVARVTRCDPGSAADALAEAEAAALLAAVPDRPGRYRFPHALVAESLASELVGARRVVLHRVVGEALAARTDAAEAAAEIAHHFFASGDVRAVGWARRAAERARALLAYEETARLYRLALDALGPLGHVDEAVHGELLLGLGEALKRAGDERAAEDALRRACDVARRLRSPELLTRGALLLVPASYHGEGPRDTAAAPLPEEAIAAWKGRDSALHARALARLAVARYWTDPIERTRGRAEEATTMARRVADPRALPWVLLQAHVSLWQPEDPDASLARIAELIEVAGAVSDRETLVYAFGCRSTHCLERGDVAGADAALAECVRLAEALRQPLWRWYAQCLQTTRAMLDRPLDEPERLAEATLALRPGELAAMNVFGGHMLALRRFQGRFGELLPMARAFAEAVPAPFARCLLAYVESRAGHPDEARAHLEELAGDECARIPRDGLFMLCLLHLAETCARLGDATHARVIYALLAPHARLCATLGEGGASLGPVAHYLGLLAFTMGRLDDAAEHFAAALAATRRMGARVLVARTQYECATVLLARARPGDSERARRLLRGARKAAEALGCDEVRVQAMGLLQAPAAPGVSAEPPALAEPNVFRWDGHSWTVVYAGRTVRLRDMRGLGYLARLLAQPGRALHVTELVEVPSPAPSLASSDGREGIVGGRIDTGLRLDARAVAAHRRRLANLADELEEAERLHDLGRTTRAREKIAVLRAELAGAACSQQRGPMPSARDSP